MAWLMIFDNLSWILVIMKKGDYKEKCNILITNTVELNLGIL